MKKSLLVAFLLVAAGVGSAMAQTETLRAPATTARGEQAKRHAAQPLQKGPIGAFPRATRGNPIQMLNPNAPAKYYGPPQDTVTYNPYFDRDPYTGAVITGLILVGNRW